MRAAQRPARTHPGRPAGLEGAERGARDPVVLGAVEQSRRAPEGHYRRGLGHGAHPGWRAAAEVEQVLPRDEAAAAPDRELRELVEQAAQPRRAARGPAPRPWRPGPADRAPPAAARARAVQQVCLLEVRQRVQLKAPTREVLEQQLAAAEGDLVAAAGERLGAPVRGVAPELQEQGGHAGGGEPAGDRDALQRCDHIAKLGPAGAPQAAQRGTRPGEGPPVAGERRGARPSPTAEPA